MKQLGWRSLGQYRGAAVLGLGLVLLCALGAAARPARGPDYG